MRQQPTKAVYPSKASSERIGEITRRNARSMSKMKAFRAVALVVMLKLEAWTESTLHHGMREGRDLMVDICKGGCNRLGQCSRGTPRCAGRDRWQGDSFISGGLGGSRGSILSLNPSERHCEPDVGPRKALKRKRRWTQSCHRHHAAR